MLTQNEKSGRTSWVGTLAIRLNPRAGKSLLIATKTDASKIIRTDLLQSKQADIAAGLEKILVFARASLVATGMTVQLHEGV